MIGKALILILLFIGVAGVLVCVCGCCVGWQADVCNAWGAELDRCRYSLDECDSLCAMYRQRWQWAAAERDRCLERERND